MRQNDMRDFQQLITTIEQVHGHLLASAANAVNQALTIRNWLIGHYIVEFEQQSSVPLHIFLATNLPT
jgi:hypothetical protein